LPVSLSFFSTLWRSFVLFELRLYIRSLWILKIIPFFRLVTMKSFFSQFTWATATLSLLAHTQAASNSSNGASCGVHKADDSYFSVVGVQGTGVHPRQDIRDLEKDTETWNMFLQALARFQAMDQDEKVSYYKVAGMTACQHNDGLL
jgi:hypothetical protein